MKDRFTLATDIGRCLSFCEIRHHVPGSVHERATNDSASVSAKGEDLVREYAQERLDEMPCV